MTDLGFWHGFTGMVTLPFKAIRIIGNPAVLDALGWVCGAFVLLVVVCACIAGIQSWRENV